MIRIVGAGFAGVEAAWACASRQVEVALYEMRPTKSSPAHTTDYFAELVCSNSLKSNSPTSPAGQLKSEMAALGSIILKTAAAHSVPGGEALCVDRNEFGRAMTSIIEDHPLISVEREEVTPNIVEKWLSEGEIIILATGPLTSPQLSEWLASKSGREHLYFYDAVSPTVEASSLDMDIVFAQSRYDKGEGDDYLNCPFNKENYEAFVAELVAAERAPFHAFEAGGVRTDVVLDPEYALGGGEEKLLEQIKYFAGCTPIEAIAEKGARSLAFGNFKPMGLTNPQTGRRPWAALQLRPENKEKSLYSLVACQTRLKFGEQKRIFRMVPGLENAEFVRFGVIHRNTYLEAPKALFANLEMRSVPNLFVAGQLTGVEGYVESAAMGILAGLEAISKLKGKTVPPAPRTTAYGALMAHLQDDTPREFAPMNINWGILPDPEEPTRDKGVKRAMKIAAAQAGLETWLEAIASGC
jgi:methylenetetrahydrofolate--tRNA-(uracil-5-)-methyltransferase